MISNIFHFLPRVLAQLAGGGDEDAPSPADAGAAEGDAFVPAEANEAQPGQSEIFPEMKAVSLANLREILDPRESIWLFVGMPAQLQAKIDDGSIVPTKNIPTYFLDSKAQSSLATIVLRKLKVETKHEGISFSLEPKSPNQKSFDAFQELSLSNLKQFFQDLEKDGLILFVGSEKELKTAIKNGNISNSKHYYRIDPKAYSALLKIVKKRIGLAEGSPKVHHLQPRVLETPRHFEEFGLAQLSLLRKPSDDDIILFVGSTDDLRIHEDKIFGRAPRKAKFYFLNPNEQATLTQILGKKFKDVFPHYDATHPSQYIRSAHGTLFVQTAPGSGVPLARKYTPALHDEMITPKEGTTAVILMVNGISEIGLTDALSLLQHELLYPNALYYIVEKSTHKAMFDELARLHVLTKVPEKEKGFVLIRDHQGGDAGIVVPEITDLKRKKVDEVETLTEPVVLPTALNERSIKDVLARGVSFVVMGSSAKQDEIIKSLKPENAEEIPYLVLDKAGRKLAARYNIPELPVAAKAVLFRQTIKGVEILKSVAYPDTALVNQYQNYPDVNGYLHMDAKALRKFLEVEGNAHRRGMDTSHYLFFGDAASQDYVDMVRRNKDEFEVYGKTTERKYIWFHGTKDELKPFVEKADQISAGSFQLRFTYKLGAWNTFVHEPFRFVHITSMAEANEYVHSGEKTPSLVLAGSKANLNSKRMRVLFNALIERFYKNNEKIKPVIVLMDDKFVQKNYGTSEVDARKTFAGLVKHMRGEVNVYWFERESYTKGPYNQKALVKEIDLVEKQVQQVEVPQHKFSAVVKKYVEILDETSIQGSTIITDIKSIRKMILITGDANDPQVQAWLEAVAKQKAAHNSEAHVYFYNGNLLTSSVVQRFAMVEPTDSTMVTRMKKGPQVMVCKSSSDGEYWQCSEAYLQRIRPYNNSAVATE